ncbi:hypothetical protein D3C76_1589700 [compost metagenome]
MLALVMRGVLRNQSSPVRRSQRLMQATEHPAVGEESRLLSDDFPPLLRALHPWFKVAPTGRVDGFGGQGPNYCGDHIAIGHAAAPFNPLVSALYSALMAFNSSMV